MCQNSLALNFFCYSSVETSLELQKRYKNKIVSCFINDFRNLKAYPIKAIDGTRAKRADRVYPPSSVTRTGKSIFLCYLFHFTLINGHARAGIPLGI